MKCDKCGKDFPDKGELMEVDSTPSMDASILLKGKYYLRLLVQGILTRLFDWHFHTLWCGDCIYNDMYKDSTIEIEDGVEIKGEI